MSYVPFAGASFAVAAKKRRSPAVNQGQVLRTMALCLSLACAALVMHHRQHALTVSLDTAPATALVHAR